MELAAQRERAFAILVDKATPKAPSVQTMTFSPKRLSGILVCNCVCNVKLRHCKPGIQLQVPGRIIKRDCIWILPHSISIRSIPLLTGPSVIVHSSTLTSALCPLPILHRRFSIIDKEGEWSEVPDLTPCVNWPLSLQTVDRLIDRKS